MSITLRDRGWPFKCPFVQMGGSEGGECVIGVGELMARSQWLSRPIVLTLKGRGSRVSTVRYIKVRRDKQNENYHWPKHHEGFSTFGLKDEHRTCTMGMLGRQ